MHSQAVLDEVKQVYSELYKAMGGPWPNKDEPHLRIQAMQCAVRIVLSPKMLDPDLSTFKVLPFNDDE